MELAHTFIAKASSSDLCAEPAFACAPAYRVYAEAFKRMPISAARTADVLGAACSVAKMADAKKTRLMPGKAAWGVASVNDRHIICLWDGHTVWAKGLKGATRLKPHHVVIAWTL